MKYDSVHNKAKNIEFKNGDLYLNGKKVKIYNKLNPKDIPWNESGRPIVCESTGLYLTSEGSQGHIDNGASKVILSAPSKDSTPMFV